MSEETTSDSEIRQHIYDRTITTGRPPLSREVAKTLGLDRGEVLDAFRRLHARRLLALAPDTGEIVMAPPFSTVPTPFLVKSETRPYFANCVWDAFGIAAALHQDVAIEASCGCCGEPMTLGVQGGSPAPVPAIAHFAVPAARWWDNITYT
jgi:DNA-binding transcriptional MocR family regulator